MPVAQRVESPDIEKLWLSYKETADSDLKNQILLNYIHLVKKIVRRMMPKYNSHNEYDDLVSCGVIGLIDAVEKFDPKRGIKFETYAVARIRGEVLDYMRAQDWAPSSLRKKINYITNVYNQLEHETGQIPSDKTVADHLGIGLDDLNKVLEKTHIFNLVYFEDTLKAGYAVNEITTGDNSSPENILVNKELKSILGELIETLPEKERLVITLYYYEEMMLKEIAEILGVSESRVSQVHSKVLAKIRLKLQKTI